MASSLLTSSGMIPTTGSTVVGRSVLPFQSSLHSLRLTHSYKNPALFISCCSSVSKNAATSSTDLKPAVERWPEYLPNKLPDENYVRVFDTTLRDGEQAPGGSLTPPQKLEIARQLAKLRVDIMEVGFPGSSEEELETVKTIAKTVGNEVDEETGYVPVICAIARSKHRDIEAAWEAVKYAKRPRILIFTSTSDIHMKYKLKKTQEEVIEMAVSSIRFAKSLGFNDIQLGCEDGGRSDKDFLCKILGEAIKADVTVVNVADTVGINMPHEYAELVTYLKANTPGIDDVVFSVHCHNDLGLATANSIAGIRAGARQVEVTINGIGERSGNASLEEVVMALKCRGAYVINGVYTRIDTRQIMATSKMVQEYTGLYVQAHKPIVGANCFVHESGIHQDGILKNRSTYEILSPEDIGIVKSQNSGLVLGKLSGRHAVKDRLKELGYELDDEKLNAVFSLFRDLTKNKKRITDADMKALVTSSDGISLEKSNGANGLKSNGYIPVLQVDEETGYVPVICAIARCKHRDIEATWEALKYAKRPRILVFTSTSDIHMKYKLKKTQEEVIEMAVSSIRFAKSLGFNDIQFGCEDGGRSDKDFLCKIRGEAIKAGVTVVTIGDTVGINMPHEYGELVTYLKANTPGIDDVVVAVHCHNDLGLATANSIAGIRAGARQVEVTINGIGERSGNASLEEVVMALKCRGAYVINGVYTRIDTRQIMATSKMVQEYTGLYVQAHKPIVGANCFVHESGIHQDGILKNRSTYEILSPEDIGIVKSQNSGLVLGKLSGRHAVKDRLKELGYELDDEKLNAVFSLFRDLTKNKKRITDADLKALVTSSDEISLEKLNGANGLKSNGYIPVPQVSSNV